MATRINRNKRFIFLLKLLKMEERKSLFKIFKEIVFLFIKQGQIPTHYFSRHLYRKEITNIYDYIPNKVCKLIHRSLNDPDSCDILNNKLFFNLFYSKFFDNLAKILMFNTKNVFVVNNHSFQINTVTRFNSVLFDLINKSATKSIFIKKTFGSHGGANTHRISIEDLPLDETHSNELYSEIINSAYLFQETIKQHAALDRLYPSSVNSIRIDAFIDQEGNAEIIYPYLRVGMGSHVDNASSGGCIIGIEPDGKLKKNGYTHITRGGGGIITSHPLTKIVFQDFEIPFYKDALQFVLQLAKIVPDLRLIG